MAISPAYNRTSADPFDRLFDSLLSNAGTRSAGNLMRAPETDVVETERAIRVVTEMPGLKRENIEIDVENNVLTLRGEKREDRTEGDAGKYHLAERRYGTFTRSFVLPRDVDAESISATFQDGVLTVTIPKSEKARRRRIKVGDLQNVQDVQGGELSQGQNGGQQDGGGQNGGRQNGGRQNG
ncbi:MAG: heat shock protein Hsp20 [Gemmatimonadetes bacterium]|nr:heat shock protein Hsp20 [Gemmatimonadota bacterium]